MYSMTTFTAVEKLQQEARVKIDYRIRVRQIKDCESTHFTEEQLMDLLRKFEALQTNETIGKSELKDLLGPQYQKLVTDSGLLDRLFQKFDRNADGVLDFREFCHAFSLLDKGKPEEKIRFIFYMFDGDKDGFIGREDLKNLLEWQYRSMDFDDVGSMIEASVQFAFSEYDVDTDNKLNFEEFVPVVFKQPYLVMLLKLCDS